MRDPSEKIAASEAVPDATRGKPLPRLAGDKEAEAFVEAADLSDHDLSALAETRFEISGEKQ